MGKTENPRAGDGPRRHPLALTILQKVIPMPHSIQPHPSRLLKKEGRAWYLSPWLRGVGAVCLFAAAGFLTGRLASGSAPPASSSQPAASASVQQAAPVQQTAPAQQTASVQQEAPAVPPSSSGAGAFSQSPPDYDALSVPEGEAADEDWFSDAALVGDSRVDGLRLYGGIKGAQFIFRTGMSIYEVAEEKENIRAEGGRTSVYALLSQAQYAKVYLSIGINELGYFDPDGYAETFGQVIDRVRELQPEAALYVMTITPVNPAVCREHDKPDYINNDMISQYNAALAGVVAEKGVKLLNPAAALTDESGALREDLAADGVHYTREGYVLWKDYLLTHT